MNPIDPHDEEVREILAMLDEQDRLAAEMKEVGHAAADEPGQFVEVIELVRGSEVALAPTVGAVSLARGSSPAVLRHVDGQVEVAERLPPPMRPRGTSSEGRELRLFDETDEGWIVELLELVKRHVGEPWRVLHERIERTKFGTSKGDPQVIATVIKRLSGGGAERARIARDLRSRVLGMPALDAAARNQRLDAIASSIGIEAADIESLLWADLSRERPVAMPRFHNEPMQLAAHGNLDKLQIAVRRAESLRIELHDDANELVRTAARYGLIAVARRHAEVRASTILEVAGPLSLFHATAMYGRALGALVPLLAEHAWTSLAITEPSRTALARGRTTYVLPPLALPPVANKRRSKKLSVAERLARTLLDACHVVEREPAPIGLAVRDTVGVATSLDTAQVLLFPDLAALLEHRRWLVEIVGFSTEEHVIHKLAAYDAAGCADVLLCIDRERSPWVESTRFGGASPASPAKSRVVAFRGAVLLSELVGAITGERRTDLDDHR